MEVEKDEDDVLLDDKKISFPATTRLATNALTTAVAPSKSCNTDRLLYFNVSGRSFATLSSTLENCPNSLLGSEERRNQLPRTINNEIFLNRNPDVFESVLAFYQYGIFEQPAKINNLIFISDIRYYELIDQAITCNIKGIRCNNISPPKCKWKLFMWNLLENPDSSTAAKVMSIASLLTILVSIFVFCIETIPMYKKPANELTEEIRSYKLGLNCLETFCIVYFTLEILLRFIASPNKFKFALDILNIVDVVSILPFYVTLIFNMDGNVSIYILRVIRLARVFRVFKLTRHSNEMKILGISVQDSCRELGVLVFFILLGVLLFSSAIYYAEAGTNGTHMTSIPQAFWWSIVTMTTVGYGDEVPISIAGRIVGAVCAMTGILVIAMPIPIIVNNFTRQYQILKPVSTYWGKFKQKNSNALTTFGLYPYIKEEIENDLNYYANSSNNNNKECKESVTFIPGDDTLTILGECETCL